MELFEGLLAKNVAVKLFILHRFINLFSLPLFCRISFFVGGDSLLVKLSLRPIYLADINKIYVFFYISPLLYHQSITDYKYT